MVETKRIAKSIIQNQKTSQNVKIPYYWQWVSIFYSVFSQRYGLNVLVCVTPSGQMDFRAKGLYSSLGGVIFQ